MMRRLFCIVLCVALTTPALAGERILPVLPAGQWKLEVSPGDQATLVEKEGCLGVKFEVNVKDRFLSGHITHIQAVVRLLLAEPVELGPQESRVLFEAAGMATGNLSVRAYPIIRDASGEQLIYEPWAYPHLKCGTAKWGKWTSRYIYSSEAGGATQEVYEAEGGDRNARPDGKCAFAGFMIRVRASKPLVHKGEMFFGGIELGGMKVPYAAPFLYADSVLPKGGQYRLAARVTNEFQGRPLREFTRALSFEPNDLTSARQKIEFPLGPDDNYWIDYQVTDANGAVVTGESLRYQVEGSEDRTPPQPVDLKTPPALGYVRINPDAHTAGVYNRDEPLAVTARVFSKGVDNLKLAWQLKHVMYDTIVEEGAADVALAGKPYLDVPISLKGEAGRDAYRLVVSVLPPAPASQPAATASAASTRPATKPVAAKPAAAKPPVKLDEQTYVLGRRSDLAATYEGRTQGLRRDRTVTHESAYMRFTFLLRDPVRSEAQLLEAFQRFVKEASLVGPDITYMVDLRDFEVLPGVYDFPLLDRLFDAAADAGCCITLRLAHEDKAGNNLYRHQRFSRQRSFDGTEAIGHHWYGSFSLSDPEYINAHLRAFKVFHDRYHRHTAYQGLYVMNIGGEWGVLDQPWRGLCGGYEAPTVAAFRGYLKDTLGLSLEQLARRWGVELKDWNDVQAPLPEYVSGSRPDMRVQWLDFCRYKTWLDKNYWYQLAARSVRSYDPNGVIILYTYNPNGVIGVGDYLHNGGNHFLAYEGTLFDAADGGLGWITEPHHPLNWAAYGDPGERGWVLDWSVFVMMSQAGGGGANMHVYFWPLPGNGYSLPAHFGGVTAYDRFARYKTVLQELNSARVVGSKPLVATLRDPSTLYCKHRTSFSDRWGDLNRWFELLQADSIDRQELRDDRAAEYKLILPNPLDEVMSKDNIEKLDRLVRGGAKMIIAANTGRYCPELGNEQYVLLQKLGIGAPQGQYEHGGVDVAAKVEAANPLFDANGLVRFFTTDQMRADMANPEIQREFFKWPYRWIPVTDYFGYYRDAKPVGGDVWARFAGGGAAVTRHAVDKGEVVVFWGTPDFKAGYLKGFMARAAAWAGVPNPREGNPIPYLLELRSGKLDRYYAILYHEKPGTYHMKLPAIPDRKGNWVLEELVSDQKLGVFSGKEMRESGIDVVYHPGYSPLKIIRIRPAEQLGAGWEAKYHKAEEAK